MTEGWLRDRLFGTLAVEGEFLFAPPDITMSGMHGRMRNAKLALFLCVHPLARACVLVPYHRVVSCAQ